QIFHHHAALGAGDVQNLALPKAERHADVPFSPSFDREVSPMRCPQSSLNFRRSRKGNFAAMQRDCVRISAILKISARNRACYAGSAQRLCSFIHQNDHKRIFSLTMAR
ncbi:hypothetical protein RZS08_50800, partial [Arthrospira platensis SPKY1]|nr:hypothetical protein [Arthrospira platensis SPKY1]